MRYAKPACGVRWTRTATAVVALGLSMLSMRGVERCALCAPTAKAADAPYPADVRARIRKAIQKGIANLQADTILEGAADRTDESDVRVDLRIAAAITWALRRAGIDEGDPAHRRAMRVLGSHVAKRVDDASLVLLALCTESLSGADVFLADGTSAKPVRLALSSADERLVKSAVALLVEKQIAKPIASPGDEFDGTGGWRPSLYGVKVDIAHLEDSHLALAALEAAARVGIEVPKATFQRGLQFLLRRQQKKGPAVTLKANEVRGAERIEWSESGQARGFDDEPNDRANGRDTAGSAMGLVICQDALQGAEEFTPELRLTARAGIRDAFAWLQQSFNASKNPVVGKPFEDPPPDDPLNDWRQAMLRIGVHARVRLLGGRDWYLEIAKALLGAQKANGAFAPDVSGHCAALLFLMRASLVSSTSALGEAGDAAATK